MPIAIYDKASNKKLFEITPAQRDQLVDALEEEHSADQDYYVDAAVCDYLEGRLDAPVLAQLRAAVGGAAPMGGEAPEGAAGDDEELPEMDLGAGIEIEWREE